LVARLNANDQTAWTVFVNRYTKPLLQVVRRSLPSRIRQKVGDDDIVQQVFRDVFLLAARRQLPGTSEGGLWALLRKRASRQILHEIRRFLAVRRDVRRESTWSCAPANGSEDLAEPVDPHADQEQPVTAHDLFVRFVNILELCEQFIVHLRLEQGTLEKVADALDWSLRKVQGIWEGICKKAREGRHMDGWMDGWMDRWMDRWIDESLIGSCDVITNAAPAR
jgi:DNA-directed RNA polymerase specialized sigma24 family protein